MLKFLISLFVIYLLFKAAKGGLFGDQIAGCVVMGCMMLIVIAAIMILSFLILF